jgi:cysteine desulfurase/selenocysteine lyase
VTYLQALGMETVQTYEHMLVSYALDRLRQVRDIEVYGPEADARSGVISFNLPGMHPHDIASILDQQGVAIRGGHHCAMPLMRALGVNGTCRASFYIYNTMEEIDVLIASLGEVKRVLRQ